MYVQIYICVTQTENSQVLTFMSHHHTHMSHHHTYTFMHGTPYTPTYVTPAHTYVASSHTYVTSSPLNSGLFLPLPLMPPCCQPHAKSLFLPHMSHHHTHMSHHPPCCQPHAKSLSPLSPPDVSPSNPPLPYAPLWSLSPPDVSPSNPPHPYASLLSSA